MKIMGVDPGLLNTGYAIIDEKYNLLDSGIIHPQVKKIEDRLLFIYDSLRGKIEHWRPDFFVMEDTFYYKNANTAIKLGAVKGICLLAAKMYNVEIMTIPPTLVKLSITGDGHSSKEKVAFMVKRILKLDDVFPSHITDAIACALAAINKIRKDAIFNKR